MCMRLQKIRVVRMRVQKIRAERMRTLRGRGCMRVVFIKVHMCVLCMTLCMHDLFN